MKKKTKAGSRLPPGTLKLLRQLLKTTPNMVGYSATLKDAAARKGPLGRLVIRIYVEKKHRPGVRLIPKSIARVPVETMTIGRVESAAAATPIRRQRNRPMLGGISCGSRNLPTSGTLGYFVEDTAPPPPGKKAQWYILSCAHVLALPGPGQETLQPSAGDGGQVPTDFVGKLTASTYVGVDAAIAKIDAGALGEIMGMVAPIGATKPVLHQEVRKSGRTTGLTAGQVIDEAFVVNTRYPGGMIRTYSGCALILGNQANGHFMEGGDSGSLVVEQSQNLAVGLIFAQTTATGLAVASNMMDVLRAFPGRGLVLPNTSWP